MRYLGSLLLAMVCLAVRADEGMVWMDIGRGEARLPSYVMSRPEATATLILLPGGDSDTGEIADGKPGSGNFLSRSRGHFFAENFNVIVVYRASDLSALDYGYRVSQSHVGELARVITFARQMFGKPVWLIGTSRGTVSGTAAAIALGENEVQGLVLTSSVTSRKIGAIGSQNIASLKMPTLVVHHKNDACKICVPDEAMQIVPALKSAPIKKMIIVEGGSEPRGDPCAAKHWHGFINYERETSKLITDWIKDPKD